jgi:transcriptional regulator CtsR
VSIGGGGGRGLVLTFSHQIAGQTEAITVVHEAIEDGVGQRRITQAVMPLLDRQLAGEDRGFLVVAVVEDFEQIALGLIGDGGDAEVVDE